MINYQKLKLILPLIFLTLIILIGLFPSLFTNEDPDEEGMRLIRPNNGYNTISIENTTSEILKIDSLIFVFEDYNGANYPSDPLIRKITVFPKNISSFQFILNRSNFKMKNSKYVIFKLFLQNELPKDSNEILIKFNSDTTGLLLKRRHSGNEYTKKKRLLNIMSAKIFKQKSFFGTDYQGRDVWARFVFGTGVILKIIFFSIIISLPVGVISGLFRGYFLDHANGRSLLAKFSNFLEAVVWLANSAPIYLLAMLIVSICGHKLINIVIAFSLVQWVEIDKLIYEKICYLKKQDFILSAKMFGKSDLNIIFTELLSLCFPQIIIGTIFLMSRIVLIESSLSFLGYSVSVPYSSWGKILADIQDYNQIYSIWTVWWIVLLPTAAIILTIFSLNTIRNYLNEKIK